MKVTENRFLSGPRASAGAVAANEPCTSHTVGAATGGADFAGGIKKPGRTQFAPTSRRKLRCRLSA